MHVSVILVIDMSNYLKFALSIVLCLLAGVGGAVFTQDSLGWYFTLHKPLFRPPNWLFSPVWIVLYITMGISFYLIWKKGFSHRDAKYAFVIFIVQLIFNASWSVIFFGGRSIFGGLLVIFVLWLLIFLTIFAFYRINTAAAYILIPYFIWVSYASILNFSIWRLN